MATPVRFLDLTAEQDQTLRELEVSLAVNAKIRLRASIIRLNNAGWSAPKLAAHFGRNLQSVHNDLNRFEHFGFEGLALLEIRSGNSGDSGQRHALKDFFLPKPRSTTSVPLYPCPYTSGTPPPQLASWF